MDALLEREAELAVLQEAVRGLSSGHGCLVLVGGEAGIGKTTLVRALRERAGAEAAFLGGGCEPLSVPVPLAPLRELGEAAGESELAEPEAGDRLQLARRLLEALAARAPAVAVVEDAHWADAATLDVLRLLARRVEEAAVAIVVTYRDDEAAANPELSRLLGDLAGRPAVRRVLLRPLSDAAVRELAAPAGVDAAGLSRVTGGNPFLVVEAIAAGGRLPATVRDATLARAARLGPAARAAVEAAAVIGQRVAPALLEQVAPGSGAAIEEALARGVIVADGPVLGFRHELLREAVESSLSPPRRAELHARVVAALAEGDGERDHARLAHHAELAGLAGDACRYAALAAADAERVGALRETSLQAARALRLGAGLAGEERIDLLVRYAHAANFASSRLEDAVEAAEEAVSLAQRLGDDVRHGRALVALAYALWSCDRVGEAGEAAERAVAVLDDTGEVAELARAQATLVRVQATTSDPAIALEHGPRALELAAELEQTRIDVEISLGLARGHLGDPEAPALLAAAARAARRAGYPIQTVRAHVNRVVVAVALRRHALVDEATAEALEVFDEHQTTIPANAVTFYRSRSLLDRGRWTEAEEVLTRRDRNMAAETWTVLAVEGLLRARRGEPHAERLVDRAWAEVRRVPEGSRQGVIRCAVVETAWLRGDHADALRELRAAAETSALRFARTGGELALWAFRYGVDLEPPPGAAEPVALELAGDWRGAIRAWRELESPYDAALAALPGDDRAARAAAAALHELGALGAARAFARERTAAGARAPRGPRRSTRAHPAGLTRREQEVLESLATGATNPGIAAALHLSERTVAHHVSSILRKLGAPTRLAAVAAARARGLLPKDGQPPPRR